jgi:hypothetical protein
LLRGLTLTRTRPASPLRSLPPSLPRADVDPTAGTYGNRTCQVTLTMRTNVQAPVTSAPVTVTIKVRQRCCATAFAADATAGRA